MPVVLHVEGMMCHRCVAKVEKVLSAVAGVESDEVDLAAKRALVLGTAAAADTEAAGAAATGALVAALR